jgi:cobalt-zinc-cadmium efflux system outer membrane protein
MLWRQSTVVCCVLLAIWMPPLYAADESASDLQNIPLDHLTLPQAERLFAGYSRELLAAKRSVQSAEADTLIAGQRPNPVLSVGFSSLNLNRGQGNMNQNGSNGLWDKTYNSSLQVSQLYERGNKRELRTSVAESAVKASEFDLKETYRRQGLV